MEERRRRIADPRAIDSVLRALDFVEDRMGDDIGVEDLARAACYSPFYFSRLFAEATGHAPYDYLMRRRVAAAAEEVVGSERSLTEIALDRGFSVPDSFGRAFRRCFGLLPSEARRAGIYPRAIARTPIDGAYIEKMFERPPPRAEAVYADGTILVGRRWERLPGSELPTCSLAIVERDAALRPIGAFMGEPGPLHGAADGGDAAGASVPAYPLSATRLPAGKRARFLVEGDAERLAFIVEFAYRAWFPSSFCALPPPYDLVERSGPLFLALELPLEEEPRALQSSER
jgi:AraC-like DNA-binding protein